MAMARKEEYGVREKHFGGRKRCSFDNFGVSGYMMSLLRATALHVKVSLLYSDSLNAVQGLDLARSCSQYIAQAAHIREPHTFTFVIASIRILKII